MNATETPLIEAENIHFSYGTIPVLTGVSLAITQGSRFMILGPNGSGKSTLIKIMARLLKSSGTLRFKGAPLALVGRKTYAAAVGYAPQASDFTGYFSVSDFVTMGRYAHHSLFSSPTEEDSAAVTEAMNATGVAHLAHRSMGELSGGERQRTLIAGALSQNPEMLLLDEPTAFLDPKHTSEIMALLMRLNRERTITIVMVTHDINQAALFGTTIMGLREGRPVFCGAPEQLMSAKNLAAIYDKDFMIVDHPAGGARIVAPEMMP